MTTGTAARQAPQATRDRRGSPRGGQGTRQFRPGSEGAVALVIASFLLVVAIPTAGAGCSTAPSTSPLPPTGDGLTVATLLSGSDSKGFARATAPRPFTFPADHGPHPEFRTEWWYFTGIVRGHGGAGGGRRFGYQFTIFRQALTAQRPARDSAWATRDVYMAHLAVSDLDGDPRRPRFHAFQRFSRDGLALAGAHARPFAVWVDSWRMESSGIQAAAEDVFPLRLRAREAVARDRDEASAPRGPNSVASGAAIDFTVAEGRGPVLQGDHGWSVKGAGAGNASFYYSCTRLPTRGRLTMGTEIIDVEGTSWLDREWSTSALDPDVVGWDWVGAHLDDGRDLMFYRLRTRSGDTAPETRVTLIDPDGGTRIFGPDGFSLTAMGQWTSPDGKAGYPAGFRLRIPAAAIDLTLRPMLSDQELRLAVRYWEGAITLQGSSGGRPLAGTGYLELTGYRSGAESARARSQ